MLALKTGESRKIPRIQPNRIGAAIYERRMIHWKKQQAFNLRKFAPPGCKRGGAAREFLPCHTPEAGDDSRPRNRKLRPEMLPAMSDFIGGGVAIAPGGIAWITSDEIGDEDARQP